MSVHTLDEYNEPKKQAILVWRARLWRKNENCENEKLNSDWSESSNCFSLINIEYIIHWSSYCIKKQRQMSETLLYGRYIDEAFDQL